VSRVNPVSELISEKAESRAEARVYALDETAVVIDSNQPTWLFSMDEIEESTSSICD